MSNGGIYIAIFHLSESRRIQVGRLGCFSCLQGVYLYVGTAQRNLSARLERHARQEKALRWHIDYLSTQAVMLGAVTVVGPREYECELARQLAENYECPMAGFGSSDCCCPSHLFYTPIL